MTAELDLRGAIERVMSGAPGFVIVIEVTDARKGTVSSQTYKGGSFGKLWPHGLLTGHRVLDAMWEYSLGGKGGTPVFIDGEE